MTSRLPLVLLLCFGIAACGGGGSDTTAVQAGPADSAATAVVLAAVEAVEAAASSPDKASAGSLVGGELPLATSVDANWVVATTGSDANPGTTRRPLATLQKAIDLALPGDTILLRAGVYPVSAPVRILNRLSGASRPLTIVGDSGAILRSSGEGLPGLWRGIVEVTGSRNVVVRGIAVENSSFFGFFVENSQGVTLASNRSTVSLGSGIYARNSSQIVIDGNDVSRFCDRNEFGAGGGVHCQEGITLSNVDGFKVQNNLVHDAPQSAGVGPGGGEGIDIKTGSRNGIVAFNSVWNLVQLGIYIDGWAAGVSNVEVHGNRVWNTYMGIVLSSEAGGTVSNISIHDNLVYDVGVDGILVSNFKADATGDGPRVGITIHNNTVVNAGIKEAKPPFYSLWTSGPFPDYGTGIHVATSNISGLAIFDNIVVGSKTAAIKLPSAVRPTARVETNLIWPATRSTESMVYDGARPLVVAPGFVGERDWHLAAGSPAIGSGSGGVALTVDADRVSRPAGPVDLGAFVYRAP